MRWITVVCLLAFGFSLEAATAKRPRAAVECEFFLSNPGDTSVVLRWIANALTPINAAEPVFLGNMPKAAAFQELGLPRPFPRASKMKIEVSALEKDLYWLKILRRNGTEVAKFPFHFPPVAVWKHVEDWGDRLELELELDRRISAEDSKVISAGTSLGEFAGGRKVVVIRRRIGSLVTIALGLDVEADRFRSYSNAPEPIVVAIDENRLWARVEVIKAHFTIPTLRGREDPIQ